MSEIKRVRSDDHPERKKKTKISFSDDPIGRHTIALRTFYRGLVSYKRLLNLKRYPGPIPRIPEYPPNYPTPDYLKQLRRKKHGTVRRLHFKNHFSKEKVEKMRIFAIKRILLQNGYHTENMKNDDNCLTLLSDLVDTFLQRFMTRLRYHKDSEAFRASPDLYDPLETTLQECGYHGVSGIAKYFYDHFVRMHDALYSDCIKELQLINTKYPVQNELPSSSTNPDLPSTSTALSSFSMNPDLPSSSTNPDLPTTSTALSSFSMNPDLPSSSTNPDLLSTSTALSSSLMNPDLSSTSTTLSSFLMNPDLPSSSTNSDFLSTSTALSSSSMNPDFSSKSTSLPCSSTNPDLLSTSTALPNSSMNPDLPNISTALPDSSLSSDLPSSSMSPNLSNASSAM